MAFLTQNKAKNYFKNLIITLVFEKNAKVFAQSCLKSPKIVIITSIPGPRTRGLTNPRLFERELRFIRPEERQKTF
jgi:hypothetical protein